MKRLQIGFVLLCWMTAGMMGIKSISAQEITTSNPVKNFEMYLYDKDGNNYQLIGSPTNIETVTAELIITDATPEKGHVRWADSFQIDGNLIDFIRGVTEHSKFYADFRGRGYVLGDIVSPTDYWVNEDMDNYELIMAYTPAADVIGNASWIRSGDTGEVFPATQTITASSLIFYDSKMSEIARFERPDYLEKQSNNIPDMVIIRTLMWRYGIVKWLGGQQKIQFKFPWRYVRFAILIDPTITVSGASYIEDSLAQENTPTSNYSTQSVVFLGVDSTSDTDLLPYYKINMSQICTDYGIQREWITDVVLWIYIDVLTGANNPGVVYVYDVSTDYDSTTLTWNLQPSSAITSLSFAQFDTTSWEQITGLNTVLGDDYGIVLYSANTGTSNRGYLTIHSVEGTNEPYLEITYTENTVLKAYQNDTNLNLYSNTGLTDHTFYVWDAAGSMISAASISSTTMESGGQQIVFSAISGAEALYASPTTALNNGLLGPVIVETAGSGSGISASTVQSIVNSEVAGSTATIEADIADLQAITEAGSDVVTSNNLVPVTWHFGSLDNAGGWPVGLKVVSATETEPTIAIKVAKIPDTVVGTYNWEGIADSMSHTAYVFEASNSIGDVTKWIHRWDFSSHTVGNSTGTVSAEFIVMSNGYPRVGSLSWSINSIPDFNIASSDIFSITEAIQNQLANFTILQASMALGATPRDVTAFTAQSDIDDSTGYWEAGDYFGFDTSTDVPGTGIIRASFVTVNIKSSGKRDSLRPLPVDMNVSEFAAMHSYSIESASNYKAVPWW